MPKWLEEAVAVSGLRLVDDFPRDLEQEILLRMALTVVELPNLSTEAIQNWLWDRGASTPIQGMRRLQGALVARSGAGVIFRDSEDDPDERRFSLAHETAHFIQDHLVPRNLALRAFGETIRPVLDGLRHATREERLSSVLGRVPLGPQIHLMTRSESGSIAAWAVEESEQRADRLALELLAPMRVFSTAARETTPDALAQRFGLPESVVLEYLEVARRSGRRPRRFSDTLRQTR
jgi:hypothetical protein